MKSTRPVDEKVIDRDACLVRESERVLDVDGIEAAKFPPITDRVLSDLYRNSGGREPAELLDGLSQDRTHTLCGSWLLATAADWILESIWVMGDDIRDLHYVSQ